MRTRIVVVAVATALAAMPAMATKVPKDKGDDPRPTTVVVEKRSNDKLWLGIGLGVIAGAGIWWLVSDHDGCSAKGSSNGGSGGADAPKPTPVVPPKAAATPKPKARQCEIPKAARPVTAVGVEAASGGAMFKVRHEF